MKDIWGRAVLIFVMVLTVQVFGGVESSNWFVPVTAHTPGVNDTFWRSDLTVYNYGDQDVSVSIYLLKTSQANLNPESVDLTVSAGATITLGDVLHSSFFTHNAALSLSVSRETVSITSRFYSRNKTCDEGSGTIIPAGHTSDALVGNGRQRGLLTNLAYSSNPKTGLRTNLGFVSICDIPVKAVVRLYNDNGDLLGELNESIEPYAHQQITWIHGKWNPDTFTNGTATIEVLTPGGKVLPYALVIDNQCSSVIYVPVKVVPLNTFLPGSVNAENSIVGVMRFVPKGSFIQGAPLSEPCRSEDEQPFTHSLSRDLAVMELEVTRQMWADLADKHSGLPPDPTKTEYSPTLDHPVQNIRWYDAVLFANLLSEVENLTPCYYFDPELETAINPENYKLGAVYCKFDADGYRLPTEGEWEYFARAGTTGPFWVHVGSYRAENCSSRQTCVNGALPELEEVAVFCANAEGSTKASFQRSSNPWGLKDVLGNVWEWCWDYYGNYPRGFALDYSGQMGGATRVLRGGSWDYDATYCRSASRRQRTAGYQNYDNGFRLVRTLSEIVASSPDR